MCEIYNSTPLEDSMEELPSLHFYKLGILQILDVGSRDYIVATRESSYLTLYPVKTCLKL